MMMMILEDGFELDGQKVLGLQSESLSPRQSQVERVPVESNPEFNTFWLQLRLCVNTAAAASRRVEWTD